jgi:GDPmannose 4,6-dehydratase
VTRTHVVTGVAGQDGVLLARLLRSEGGRVVGTVRPGSPAAARMAPYLGGVEIVEHDVRDAVGFRALIETYAPDEVYNLAAMSSVCRSWDRPAEAEAVNGTAPRRLLDVLRDFTSVRFLQAASAEESGEAADSPYARGKIAAHEATTSARDAGRFACAAVLHIHESPLRGRSFVSRKVTRAAVAIADGLQDELVLGNLDVRRDWGAATDHVRAMRLMLLVDEPSDLEIGTGRSRSIRDLVETAFSAAGIDDPWPLVRHDPQLLRPADTDELFCDPTEAVEALGWRPRHTFEETIAEMVRVDRLRLRSGVEDQESYLARIERT